MPPSVARNVHALAPIPIPTGSVAAAIDHAFNGLYAEVIVVPGLVAGDVLPFL
jgi:hypothetical protein